MEARERVAHHHLFQGQLQLADPVVRLLRAQQRPRAGQQLRRVAGAGNVIVGAELEAADALRRLATVRSHQHREEIELAGLQAGQQVEAVHVRQHAAENDEIGVVGSEIVQRLGTAARLDDRHAGLGEQRPLKRALRRLCLHDQDAGFIRHTVPPCSRCVEL